MSAIGFPTRGRKFCPTCDEAVLTVWQLEAHIAECHRRTTSPGVRHAEPSNAANLQSSDGVDLDGDEVSGSLNSRESSCAEISEPVPAAECALLDS